MKSIQVRTADGVCLVGTNITADRDERDLAIVLAHGFTVTVGRPHVQRVAARFARTAASSLSAVLCPLWAVRWRCG